MEIQLRYSSIAITMFIAYLQLISPTLSKCCRPVYCPASGNCNGFNLGCRDCHFPGLFGHCGRKCNVFGCFCRNGCREGECNDKASGFRRLTEDLNVAADADDASLEELEEIREQFELVDINKDGKISFDETKIWFIDEFDEAHNDNDPGFLVLLQTVFDDMDTDGDEYISPHEFDEDLPN